MGIGNFLGSVCDFFVGVPYVSSPQYASILTEYEAMQQRHYDAMCAHLAAEEARKRKKRLQSSKLRRLASHGSAA